MAALPLPPRRLAALALAAAAALSACTADEAPACPGEQVATLTFTGALTAEPLAAGLDPDPSAPGCAEDLEYPEALAPFTATVSTDPDAGTAALCRTAGRAQPLYGTLSGGRLEVATSTDGAVLAGPCSATCIATMAFSLRGRFSGEGETLRLDGALVERLAPRAAADCGACVLPCAARFVVVGLPPAAP